MLHLANGGFAPGELVPSSESNRVRWQADSFVTPFDFALAGVTAVHFPIPAELPRPVGDYCFELAGGDVLFGSLVALDRERAEIDVPRIGRLHVQRSSINRMYRWRSSGDLIYLGPNGLVGWREVSAKQGWREEQGQPWTDQEGAAIRGDFKLPARATIEFEISWKNKPDFVLALGVNDEEKTIGRAFRFEVWERDLIIQRETEQEADVASVGEIAPGPGRIHRIAYLDQEKGRILVFSVDGKPLADLKVAGGQAQALGSIHLANKRGDLRLERLRIGRWNGEAPRQVETDRSRIHRVDGSIIYGQVNGFDAASRTFVVSAAKEESRIPEDQIAGVFLSLPGDARRPHPGGRLPGRLTTERRAGPRGEEQLAALRPGDRGASELAASWSAVAGVIAAAGDSTRRSAECPESSSFREFACPAAWLMGVSSPGRAAWSGSLRGAARQAPHARVCQGESSTGKPPAQQSGHAPRAASPSPGPRRLRRGFPLGAATDRNRHKSSGKRKSLYLRSGDVIPSEITSIDENGVSFRTSLSASTFVAHDKVKAVELAQQGDAVIKINKPKRERLLTLPRMQKENPPTHLIRSRTGDFIRGRLIKMDDKTLQVELRLEPKDIPATGSP